MLRPNQGQARGPLGRNPKTQANNARGRLNHVNAEEAAKAPDVVMGTFLVDSVPAKVLFDSGASHSFVTEHFVSKGGLTASQMARPMIIQIPGSQVRANLSCKEVRIDIHGCLFKLT
jgi:hypothetical protein